MQDLETGKDKIKKICDILREETLEPAKHEAKKITSAAEREAFAIVEEAKKQAIEIIKAAREEKERERVLFEAALAQSGKQAMDFLKQEIEENLFNKELISWLEKTMADPQVASDLIKALVMAIEKEGTSADFSAYISKNIPVEKVNSMIAQDILKKLKEKGILIGDFLGGVRLLLRDKKIILDISDEAIFELLSKYSRKEFRKYLFNS